MEGLAQDIKKRIKGKLAIVGIGNIIRGDDGLGPKFIEMIRARRLNIHLFDCGTAPENYIFPILSSSCDTVIFIDAADFHGSPGHIRIFDLDEISNVSFSTHSPSPRLFTDLLKTGKDGLNMFIISIQPKKTALGEGLSEEIKNAVVFLTDAFVRALS